MKSTKSTPVFANLTLIAALLLLGSISQTGHAGEINSAGEPILEHKGELEGEEPLHRAVVNAMDASFLIPQDWRTEAIIHPAHDLWDVSFNAYKPSALDEPYKTAFHVRLIEDSTEKTGFTAEQYVEDRLLKMSLRKAVVSDVRRTVRNGMKELSYSYVVEDAVPPVQARVSAVIDEHRDRVTFLFFQSLPWTWHKDYIVGRHIMDSYRQRLSITKLTRADPLPQCKELHTPAITTL